MPSFFSDYEAAASYFQIAKRPEKDYASPLSGDSDSEIDPFDDNSDDEADSERSSSLQAEHA